MPHFYVVPPIGWRRHQLKQRSQTRWPENYNFLQRLQISKFNPCICHFCIAIINPTHIFWLHMYFCESSASKIWPPQYISQYYDNVVSFKVYCVLQHTAKCISKRNLLNSEIVCRKHNIIFLRTWHDECNAIRLHTPCNWTFWGESRTTSVTNQ